MVISKNKLEKIAKRYDSSKHFDSVIAYYDKVEIKKNLKARKILEVGSSGGSVSKFLVNMASQLDIVEGSSEGILRTKKALKNAPCKVRYFNSLWEDFKPDTKYTDIVFIRGLEHVQDPVKLLNIMKNWLTDDGRLHIIVPNANSLHRKILVWRKKLASVFDLTNHDKLVGHVRVYDMPTLKNHVRASNLKIKMSKGFLLKPLSAVGMGKITMNPRHVIVRLCSLLGKMFQKSATQCYVVCEKRKQIKTQIIPAIIAKDSNQLNQRLNLVKSFSGKAQMDIMDGHFVRNESFLFKYNLPKELSCEAHIMAQKPFRLIKRKSYTYDKITVHIESKDIRKVIKRIPKEKLAIAINPKTKIKKIVPFLPYVSEVLVMSVNPGKYGSKFQPGVVEKIKQLKSRFPWLSIAVDGGVNNKNINLLRNAGANKFIVGSYIMNNKNPMQAYQKLQNLISGH
ncbi:methyltransferase domain-containing protein [Candidatus Pacearchaeota archaeon]|nr:methyltransferase domain-containing protein [Candidatus Pacearchaeota archaeon]